MQIIHRARQVLKIFCYNARLMVSLRAWRTINCETLDGPKDPKGIFSLMTAINTTIKPQATFVSFPHLSFFHLFLSLSLSLSRSLSLRLAIV